MTPLEMYDRIAEHLLYQGRQSVSPHDEDLCAYRGSGGTKCAVGYIITDGEYTPALEGLVVGHAAVRAAVEASIGGSLTDQHHAVLCDMQMLHDGVPVCQWAHELETRREVFTR